MRLVTAALVASYIVGAAIAVATGVGTLADALTNGTKLSAPIFLIVLEALAAWRGGRAGAIALLAATSLSLLATAFDGDLANAALSPGHVVWQGVETALALAVWVSALTRTRSRPAVA